MANAKAKSKAKSKLKAGKSGASSGKASGTDLWLRHRTDRRVERRFAPKSNNAALGSFLLTSLGALAIGAGVFGQFLRAQGPHPYGVHLLVGGALVFAAGFFLGTRTVPTLRVGDAGIAVERNDQVVERLAWHEVDAVRFASGTLVFSGAGKVVSISTAAHPDAAAYAVREGRHRIPARMAEAPDLPAPPADAGSPIVLEEAQLAGLRCAASSRLISFEADARMCGRCGQAYHKDEVPERCVSCDALLTKPGAASG